MQRFMKGLGIYVCCSNNSLVPVMEAHEACRHATSPRQLYPVLWCRAALGQMESTLPLFEVLELRWEKEPAPSAQSKFTASAWHLQPTGISPHTCRNKDRKTLGLPGLLVCD